MRASWGANLGPFYCGEPGRAPTCGWGVSGESLPCSPILNAPGHRWDHGPARPHPRHSPWPRPHQPPRGARALPASTSCGLEQGFRAAPQRPTLSDPPCALPGTRRSTKPATKPKPGKSSPREGLSLLGPAAGHCSALAAACPASQTLARRHGDREMEARTELEIASCAAQGAAAHDGGSVTRLLPAPEHRLSHTRRLRESQPPPQPLPAVVPRAQRARAGRPAKRSSPLGAPRPLGAVTFPWPAVPLL